MKIQYHRFVILFLALLMTSIMSGCASNFIDNAYQTLSIGKATYDNGLSAIGDLYKDGKIDGAVKIEAIKYGTLYMNAHNQAAEALLEYQVVQNSDAKNRVKDLINFASEQLTSLLNLLKPYFVPVN